MSLILILGLNEFLRFFSISNIFKIITILFLLAIYILKDSISFIDENTFSILICFCFLLTILGMHVNQEKFFYKIVYIVYGIIYVFCPFILLDSIVLVEGIYNPWSIMIIFILIWMNDSFAYIFGFLFGKHKIFERVSPKKTIEGFIGGIVMSLLMCFIIVKNVNVNNYLHWHNVKLFLIDFIIITFGNYGDFIESFIKRTVEVKDSGTLIPGHGGVLDRFDSFLGVIPFIYIVNKLVD